MATNDKYDRQLRLWGASGQRSLGSTTVVLVGASASGTETLKNLVLPGVGAIHVVDDGDAETVPSCRSASSGGAGAFGDFFVFKEGGGGSDGSSGGGDGDESMEVDGEDGEEEKKSSYDDVRSRAEVACANLAELNPDVKGGYTTVPSLSDASYGPLLEKIQSDNQSEKLLVVASDLQPAALLPLSSTCYDESIPLLIVKSYGLIGTVRVQVKRHVVIESKPDSSVADLRLACPSGLFDQLKTLAEEGYADLDAMDSKEHGHVPYVIILIKAMEKWRREKRADAGAGAGGAASEGGGGLDFPETSEEKAAFREIIKSMSRNFDDELNFQEAYNDAYLAYATKDIPWEVQELIDAASDDPMDTGDGGASDGKQSGGGDGGKFDILVLALKKFMEENDGQPPLNGSIPDMTAATEPFVALQGAYRSKADEDRTRMRTLVEEVRAKKRGSGSGGGSGGAAPEIGDEELATFCKNVHNLRTMETRSYAEEYRMHSPPADDESTDAAATADDPPLPSVSPREQEIRDDLLVSAMDPYDPQPEHTPLLWHIALRACESYMSDHGRYPGSDGRTMALSSDADDIHVRMASVAKSMGLAECDLIKTHLLDDPEKKHATEVVRYHNAEVHTVASVVGGVASQEAVKLITGQYVPLDDTYVYNGIAGVGGVYKL